MLAAPVLALVLLAQGTGAPDRLHNFWVVKCDFGPSENVMAPQVRVFRIGPGVLQERPAISDRFGPNLCRTLPCQRNAGRLEGSVGTASLILTISLDPQARQATWRTVGASGLKRVEGPCAVQPDSPENHRGEDVFGTP